MATKFKKPSKKTTIALVVAIVILLIIAVTGTVAFLKDRGRTEAADLNTTQQDDVAQSGEENSNQPGEETLNPEQGENQGQIEGTDTNTQTGEQEGQTTIGAAGANNQNAGTTNQVDNIQETTIERVETVEIPEKQISEGHYIGWAPMGLTSFDASSKLNVNDSKDIEISKQAFTNSGSNVVTRGETITYTILVKNNSDEDMTDVEVKDRIPEMTTYVEESADNSVTEVVEDEKVIGLIWNLDLKAGEEKTLSFKVIVKDDATGVIINIAFANGEETEPVENTIIEATKTVAIEGKETEKVAKVGDKLIYTITVKNTGNVEGTANVQDTKLKELIDNGILKVDEESKEIANKLIEGTTIDVPAEGEATINFKVEILKVDGAIENTVVVGEDEPKATVDTVNITGEKTNTIEGNKVKPGDEFSYNIVLTNSGNTEGTVKVTDSVPEQLEVIGTNPIATVNGNEVDFGDVTVEPGKPVTLTINVKVKETATGDIQNIAKVDGEDVEDPETIKIVNITATKTNTDEDNKVKPGEEFSYNIVLTNSGNAEGTVKVTDSVPAQLEVIGTTPAATVSGNEVDFGDVTVEPGKTVTLTIKVKVRETATGDIQNIAKVDGEEVKDPETIKTVNITATKTNTDKDNKVKPGEEFSYNIVLTNSGNAEGTVKVTDSVPAQLEVIGTTPVATISGNEVDFGNVTVEPGKSVTLTINVKVKETATGDIQNIAKVDEKDVPDTEITIEDVVDITATKINTDEDNKVKPGDEFSYNIVLTNNGNVGGTAKVTDSVPAQLQVIGTLPAATINGNEVDFGNIVVEPGKPVTLTINVKVRNTATGDIQNIAKVDGENVKDPETIKTVNITAIKSSNIEQIAKVGQEVTYTIKAINNGTIAGDAIITDQLPSGLTYKNATITNAENDTISQENGLITWNVKDLQPGEENSRELTIIVTVDDFEGISTTITNEVKVDGNKTSETTIEVGKPVIKASKTSEIISCDRNELEGNTVHEGDQIQYTITVNNTGKVEKVINITDNIPAGVTFVDGTLEVKFAGNAVAGAKVENEIVKLENYTLTTGGTLTISFTVKVDKFDDLNEKTIAKNVAVVDGENVPDENEYEVLKPIISSEKTSSIVTCTKGQTTGTIVHENDQIKYTITVKNTGKTSGKVTVEDTIKDGLSYVSGTATAKVDGTSVTGLTVDDGKLTLTYTLEAGKTLVIEFTVKVNELPEGEYGKTIEANIATVNGTPTTDEKEYNVVKPNIVPNKTSEIIVCSQGKTTGTKVHEGDTIRYIITVANTGTDSEVIAISDNIPEGVTYVDGSLSAKLNDNTVVTATISGRQVKVDSYKLEAGKTLTVSFDVTIDALGENETSKQIANNIAVVNGNNVPDDGGYEVEKPQITASKIVDKTQAEYGDELTYTITATNVSTVEAVVNISDPIPANTEFVPESITINGNSVQDSANYDAEKDEIVYTGTLTGQNESVIITFKVRVIEEAIGTVITNTANINGEEKQATTTVVKTVTVGTESTKVNSIDLVLVLDVSGSMDDNDKIDDLISSAKTLVNKVFAESTTTSRISLITYSTSARLVGTYNYAQKTSLTNAINGLNANGGTNIYAALNQANTTVAGLGTEREKVVVFLTDGSPTIPDYISGVHSNDNRDNGYTNNVKDKIVEKADALKALSKVKKVYAIGLGVDNFNNTNVRHADECTTITLDDLTSSTTFDTENHTFTITITNPNDRQITLEEISVRFDNIDKLSDVANGDITGNNDRTASWEDISIGANESITLTGTYEPSYRNGNEREPSVQSVNIEYNNKICITEAHTEQFNGSDLYSVIKTKDGKQYHCITERTYAKYLLSKISSDGTSMNVTSVSTAFDEILKDISTTEDTYTIQEGTVIEIPETNTIISDVTVTIGESSNTYTLDQLKAGINGLVYINTDEFKGFKWTITGEVLLTNKLLLEYKIDE